MKCAEPDCGGIVVDGYCEVCGTAPAPDAPAASQPVSTATAASASATPSARTASVRTSRTGSSTKGSSRGRLGAGIVEIPRIPKGDPVAAIWQDPQVPESSRYCGNHECNKPVGRGRTDNQGAPRASAPSAARDIHLFPSFLVAT
jgi:serine/threonine-protein kinase PknG